MTRFAACCLLLFISLGSMLSAENIDSGLCDKPAPIVVLKTLDGSDFYLRDYCGQPRSPRQRQERNVVVMSFFTSWCKNCKNEIPVLQQLSSELSQYGAKFFLVNVGESKDTVENYVFQNVTTLPVLMDQYEVASKKYQVKELPTLVMIDRDGLLKEYHTGFVPAFGDSIRSKVQALLGMGQAGNSGHAEMTADSVKTDSTRVDEKPTINKNNKKK